MRKNLRILVHQKFVSVEFPYAIVYSSSRVSEWRGKEKFEGKREGDG